MNGTPIIFDLAKLNSGKRVEAKDPLGHIIADPNFKVEAGAYKDSNGATHPCIAFSDPQLENGARRVYVLPKAGAMEIARQLRRAANEAQF